MFGNTLLSQELNRGSINRSLNQFLVFLRLAHSWASHNLQQWACENSPWLCGPGCRQKAVMRAHSSKGGTPGMCLEEPHNHAPRASSGRQPSKKQVSAQAWRKSRAGLRTGVSSHSRATLPRQQSQEPLSKKLWGERSARVPLSLSLTSSRGRKRRQRKKGRKEHAETSQKIKGGRFPLIKPVIRLWIKLNHRAFHFQSAILRLIRLY